MICCISQVIPFLNVPTSSIPYVGTTPTVQVSYLQPDGSFLVAGVFTSIRITGTAIEVDHGGNQSGIIKITQ